MNTEPTGPRNLTLTKNSTIVGNGTSTGKYLVCDINGKKVGLELFTFEYGSPNINLITPYTDFVLDDATIITDGVGGYGAGLVLNFTGTASAQLSGYYPYNTFSVPLFQLTGAKDKVPSVVVRNATISNEITATGTFLVIKIGNDAYGLQLGNYNSLFPFTETVSQSAVTASTDLFADSTLFNSPAGAGSTNLNSKVKTYQDAIRRVKNQLGYPIVEIELCDEQIVEFIDVAMEWYTKYAGYTEEFFVFDSTKYPFGKGFDMNYVLSTVNMSYANRDKALSGQFVDYDLDSFRKVINIFSFDQAEFTGTDALFTLEYVYAQQIYYSYMLGSYGFDLTTWETLKQFLDTRKRMFSATPRVLFDGRTQRMRIIPEPDPVNPFIGIIGLYLERPIKDIIKERWVQQYTLALAKIAIGHIRGKYGNVNLFGGGSIQGGDMTSQGVAERDKLEEEIMKNFGEVPPPLMFVG